MRQKHSETNSTDDSVASSSDEIESENSESENSESESETETETTSGESVSETDDEDAGMENLELAKTMLLSLSCKLIHCTLRFHYILHIHVYR